MLPEPLHNIVSSFQQADQQLRLELLVDYANKLPSLPPQLETERELGLNQLPECRTPVHLWVEADPVMGTELHAHAREEAPTVRGILSVLVHGCRGAPPKQVAELPSDLIQQLGLDEVLRMQRQIRINLVLERIRREVPEALARELSARDLDWMAEPK